MSKKPGSLINILTFILVAVVAVFIVITINSEDNKAVLSAGFQSLAQGVLPDEAAAMEASVEPSEVVLPFKVGETLTYGVTFKRVKIGTSTLTFLGTAEIDGKQTYLIRFYTDTIYLKDTEKIYADKETFLPLRVERDVNKSIGFSERIVEEYDQENFTLTVSKKGFVRKDQQTITSSGPIHNAILLSYLYRADLDAKKEETFAVNLPTKQFDLSFGGKEEVDVPLGMFEACVFSSEPSQFSLWIADDGIKTPLMIEDPQTFGYALKLKAIEQVEEQDVIAQAE
ncbi:DUF3108 domain-containing protein [Candidatus Omnitrophota bacterium]